MNYKIILCLLFVLINSTKEFHPLFEKTMTINLLSKSDFLGDTINCGEADTKDQCLAIINPEKYYQCCYVITKTDFLNSESCSKYPKVIETYQKITKSSQYKACLKELYGVYLYNGNPDIKSKMNINCNNGELTISLGYDTYTKNEQNILENENHCLNKNTLKLLDYNYDIGKCEKGLLLESSKSVGLECGYFLFNIKINSEKSLTYKTCNIFNLDILSNEIAMDPKIFNKQVESIINTHNYSSFESYNAEFYDIKGRKIKYDSTTRKIIINDPDDEPAPSPDP